jgi:prepilin-type N-terminal cleavage/methylation domain-containing protein
MRALHTTRVDDRAGLTLVEILIALTILAVVLLPVMVGFAQALITTSQSSTSAVASSIARQTIESAKAAGYSNAAVGQTTAAADLVPGDAFFQVKTTITEPEPDDASHKGLKKIEVLVYQKGSSYAMVALATYISPVGV